MSFLVGKNVVLISPSFFGYEYEVARKIESFGARVHFIDDRFSNNGFIKAYIRLGLRNQIVERYKKRYFNKHFTNIDFTRIDYVLALSPEGFSEEIISKVKAKNPDCQFILYMFDSFRNKPKTIQSLPYYDRMFTFDSQDAKIYNLVFLPLFYVDDYKQIQAKVRYKYKFCFIGTAHTDRYFLVKKIVNQFFPNQSFLYFYLQNSLLYFFFKFRDPNFKQVKYSDISFRPLEKRATIEAIENSEIIIDIQHQHQIGLTMRQIEMIGARKKVITTNADVVNYDFYILNNILVVDRENPEIPEKFLDSNYIDLQKNIYEKYSIDSWIKTIFQ